MSGPLVGTPECVSHVILCCIYVAGLIEPGCFATSGIMCLPFLAGVWGCTRTIDSYYLLCFFFNTCSRVVDLPTCGGWRGGGLSQVFSVSSGGLLVWGHFSQLALGVSGAW